MAGGVVAGVGWLELVDEDPDDGDLLWDDAAASEGSDEDADPLVEEHPAAQDPLVEAASQISPSVGWLLEAAYRWLEHEHPRWPKGTPRGGQFIEAGQQFNFGGKLFEIDALVKTPQGGKILAHVGSGKYVETATHSFDVKTVGGEATLPGIEAPQRRAFKAGKGLGLDLPTVDPYVDEKSHDPSIPIPAGSKISPEQWKRFGKVDQELYVHLQNHFGAYSPSKTAGFLKKAFAEADSTTQNAVKATWEGQYGSSSGTRFNFAGLVHGITDKLQLESAHQRRERLKGLMAEVQAVMEWDLYNRVREPDISVFHRSTDGVPWWKNNFIHGENPVMSGMSQSWKFSANHLSGFGNTVIATPLAIRNVCMANPFVVPVHSGFTNHELEVATPDGLAINDKTFVFGENQLHSGSPQAHKWLSSATLDDVAGGSAIYTLRDAMEKGTIPPLPPAKPVIKLDKAGGKLWLDPPANVGSNITLNANGEDLPGPQSIWQLGYATPDGEPDPQPINQLGVVAGDFIEGMKGSRYVILDDPGDTAFPYRYFEIGPDGSHMGKSYNFEGGGVKSFKKLNGHYDLPKPKVEEGVKLWDPAAWAHGETKTPLQNAKVGDKFKVNDHPYEVTGTAGVYGNVPIKSLETGDTGSINSDYHAALMVPVADYVPETEIAEVLTPKPGVTFAYGGEKYVVTKKLKSGQIQAKRHKGAGTVKLDIDDPVLQPENLHDPEAWTIGSQEVKVGDLQPGQKFHGGTGVLYQKPYLVTENDGKVVKWRNLDTGVEGEMKAKKKVKTLVPAQADAYVPVPGVPVDPATHMPENWLVSTEKKKISGLQIGDKFVFDSSPNLHFGVTDKNAENGDLLVKTLAGDGAGNESWIPVEQWSQSDAFGTVTMLHPKTPQALGGPVSGFNHGGYIDGDTMAIDDMPEGTVFVGAKDVPYLLVKKGPKSGAVATNLLTGKPYPAIKYAKEFKTLTPKATVDLDRDQLLPGDQVKVGKLEVGDQFKTHDGEILQVTALSNSHLQGPEFTKVTPNGLHPIASSFGSFPDMPVEFYAKAGEGYDPTVKLPELEPKSPGELPDAVTGAGFAAYKSSAGPGGAYKHDRIKDMGVGTVFQDKNGVLWMVKQQGPQPMITNGQDFYSVDGSLRGRAANLSPKLVEAFTTQVGNMGAAPTPSEHPDAVKFVANGTGMDLSVLQPGEHFKKDGEIWKVTGHGVLDTFAEKADGTTKMFTTASVPDEVEMQSPPSAPPLQPPEPELKGGIEFYVHAIPQGALFSYKGKTYESLGQGDNGLWGGQWIHGDVGDTVWLDSNTHVNAVVEQPGAEQPGITVGKTYEIGPHASVATSTLDDLTVGDLYAASPETNNTRIWRVTNITQSGVTGEKVIHIEQWYGPDVGQKNSFEVVEGWKPVALFKEPAPTLEPYVPEFDHNNYEVHLTTHKAESVKPGVVFYFDQKPYVKLAAQDELAPWVNVQNLESGEETKIGADEQVVPIIPKAGPKVGSEAIGGLVDGPKLQAGDLKPGMYVMGFSNMPPLKVVEENGEVRLEVTAGSSKGGKVPPMAGVDYTQLVPVGSPQATGLINGLPVYSGGETVAYKGQQWNVVDVSSSGSILMIKSLLTGDETKIGKGNVTLIDKPGAGVVAKPGVGQKVLPSQMEPGMEFKAVSSGVVFHVDGVTPVDGGKFALDMTIVGSPNEADLGQHSPWTTDDDYIQSGGVEWEITKLPDAPEYPDEEPVPLLDAPEDYEYHAPDDFDKGIAPEGAELVSIGDLNKGDQFNFPHGQKPLTVVEKHQYGSPPSTLEIEYSVTEPATGESHSLTTTDTTQDVWKHPTVSEIQQGVGLVKEMQVVADKYGGYASIPVDADTVGYKAEWGSGGAFRYRPLWWVGDGDQFYSKSGGLWQRLGAIPAGVVAVNIYTGEGRVFPNSSLKVKPPKGQTWK